MIGLLRKQKTWRVRQGGRRRVASLYKVGVYLGMLAVLTGVSGTRAEAIIIGDREYSKMFALDTYNDFGLWSRADKFFTFVGNDNYIRPNLIKRAYDKAPEFDGVSFRSIQAMGETTPDDTQIASGVFDLYGPGNSLLLSGSYVSDSSIDFTLRKGTAGQLNVFGVYTVTGGSLFESGLVSSQLYLEIAYDYVWKNSSIDLKTNRGTWTFYGIDDLPPPEPPTEVPEPMSMSLLAAGLFGACRLKRNKCE